jgi:hypothetical protein
MRCAVSVLPCSSCSCPPAGPPVGDPPRASCRTLRWGLNGSRNDGEQRYARVSHGFDAVEIEGARLYHARDIEHRLAACMLAMKDRVLAEHESFRLQRLDNGAAVPSRARGHEPERDDALLGGELAFCRTPSVRSAASTRSASSSSSCARRICSRSSGWVRTHGSRRVYSSCGGSARSRSGGRESSSSWIAR